VRGAKRAGSPVSLRGAERPRLAVTARLSLLLQIGGLPQRADLHGCAVAHRPRSSIPAGLTRYAHSPHTTRTLTLSAASITGHPAPRHVALRSAAGAAQALVSATSPHHPSRRDAAPPDLQHVWPATNDAWHSSEQAGTCVAGGVSPHRSPLSRPGPARLVGTLGATSPQRAHPCGGPLPPNKSSERVSTASRPAPLTSRAAHDPGQQPATRAGARHRHRFGRNPPPAVH